MKICFVLEHFYPHIGGGETLFKEYTTRLAALGCEVKVATSNSGGVTGQRFYDGVEVQHFPWPSFFGHPFPNPKDAYPFAEWADVIHGAIFPAAPVALRLARKFAKPCVVTVYEVWGRKWFWVERNPVKAALFYAFEQFVINRDYPLCHAISHATEKDLRQYARKRQPVVTIYPGLKSHMANKVSAAAPVAQPSTDTGRKTFLYYGRPGKTKGLFVLFDAIKAAAPSLPAEFSFDFILANNPAPERKKFVNLIARHHLADRIRILEPMPEDRLMAAIQSAYCVIVPSITEGFGYAAAETCSLGTPIISSDGGSLPEVVSGRALFFKNRDSEDLAKKLRLAAQGAFETIPRKIFNWDESTATLLAIYKQLLRRQSNLGEPAIVEDAREDAKAGTKERASQR